VVDALGLKVRKACRLVSLWRSSADSTQLDPPFHGKLTHLSTRSCPTPQPTGWNAIRSEATMVLIPDKYTFVLRIWRASPALFLG
jgi:hypothetical protein